MKQWIVLILILAAIPALAQEGSIQKARVKKVAIPTMTLTLTLGGADHDFLVTPETRIFGAEGKEAQEALKTIKVGTEVFFKVVKKNGADTLVGVKPVEESSAPPLPHVDTSSLKPLTDMGADAYLGSKGGLYPNGINHRPAGHEKAGLALANTIQPLDPAGKPNAGGKIVLLSVGMSNTAQASEGFARLLAADPEKNLRLVFVNGAQGGMTAKAIQNPDDHGTGQRYWTTSDERLRSAGVTPAQVQVVWIKQADAAPHEGFPQYAQTLMAELKNIVQVVKSRYPNVKLAYLSSRTYGGYARTPLNPEPYAYESGYSVKWLIEMQIKGDPALNFDPAKGKVSAPWLSWGPYLWANGATNRSDGFSYPVSDFGADGTHESPSGQEKVGRELLRFFKTDSTTKPWFLNRK